MRRSAVLWIPALACGLALAGCASDGGASPAAPRSGSTSSAPTPEAEEPTEPAEPDPFPDVEPADGPRVEMQAVSMRFPRGFEVYQRSPRLSGAKDAEGYTWVRITDMRITAGWDLDRQAREHRKALDSEGTYERGPDAETAACTMFTFTGVERGGGVFAEAGCEVAGSSLILRVSQDQGRRAVAQRLFHQVLESLEPR